MKKIKPKYKILLLMLLLLGLIFKVYNIKNAESIVHEYYSSIQREDYKKAYSYFSQDTKKDIKYNQFEEFYTFRRKLQKLDSFTVSKGLRANGIVIIPVATKSVHLYDESKAIEGSFKLKLQAEKAKYKLIVELDDFNMEKSQLYIDYIWESFIWGNDIEPDEAVGFIDKAIEYDAGNPDIYYTYAMIAKNEEDVLYLLDKSIELASQREYRHLTHVYNMKGETLNKQNKLKDARDNYLLAIEEDKKNEIALNNLEEVNKLLGINDNLYTPNPPKIKENPQDKEKNIVELDSKYLKSHDREYIKKILSIMDDYYIALSSIDNLLENPYPDSASWAGELVSSVKLIELLCGDIDNTIPPNKFKRMHKEMYFASKSWRVGMRNLMDAIDNLDESAAKEYKINIDDANKRIEKATEELNKLKKEYGF